MKKIKGVFMIKSDTYAPLYFSLLPDGVFNMVRQYSANRESPNLAGQVDPKIPLIDLFAPAVILETYSNFRRDYNENWVEVNEISMEWEIKRLEEDNSLTDREKYERISKIKDEILNLKQARQAALNRFNSLYPRYMQNLLHYEANIYKLLKTALGGEDKYNQFPILDIGDRNDSDHLDFITEKEVTHPIMQGKGNYHRRFFVIKAVDSYDNSEHIQVFYQHKGDWYTSGTKIVHADPIMEKGFLSTPRIIYDLHDLATEGSVPQQEPSYETGRETWVYSKEHTWTLIQPPKNNP
jgi:hypothetical protein